MASLAVDVGYQRVGTAPLRPLPSILILEKAGIDFYAKHGDSLDRIIFDALRLSHCFFVPDSHYADARDCRSDPTRTCWKIATCVSEGSHYISIMITSPWHPRFTSGWKATCATIKYLTNRALEGTQFDIPVDIMSPVVGGRTYLAPVYDREDLDRDWERLREGVQSLLEKGNKFMHLWNCIGLFRFGLDKSVENNPPTVLVTMDRLSSETRWQPTVDAIENFLSQTGHGLQFHIHQSPSETLSKFELITPKNQVRAADPLLSWKPYEEKVSIGKDLSASLYVEVEPAVNRSPMVGTLGCYIEIKNKDGKWKPFALTNYHIVRPAIPGYRRTDAADYVPPEAGSPLRDADLNGFKPGHNFRTSMESPSRSSHNRTAWFYTHGPDKDEEESKVRLEECLAFFDSGKNVFGRLYAGSGYTFRTPTNGRLDWALIEVHPSRIGSNKLPDRNIWPLTEFESRPPKELAGRLLRKPVPAHEVFQDKTVYKISAITKATSARFSHHAAAVKLKESSYLVDEGTMGHSYEACFLALNQGENSREFTRNGDSGAVIYDERGRSVCLLFRGRPDLAAPWFTLGYATPMVFVLAHIAQFLGLQPSDVRIAEF